MAGLGDKNAHLVGGVLAVGFTTRHKMDAIGKSAGMQSPAVLCMFVTQ